MRAPLLSLLLGALLLGPVSGQSLVEGLGGAPAPRWFKGNTHAHARIWLPLPHGDSGPRRVARWYKEHGYQFLCLSDHDRIGREDRARDLEDEGFVFLPGSEVTSDTRTRLLYQRRNPQAPERIVHSTALGVDPETWDTDLGQDFGPGDTVAAILARHRAAIEAAGGIAIANHPNFKGQIAAQDVLDAGVGFFEVYNAYPHAKNFGSGAQPSTEALWDTVLSQGRLLYGVASDDAHHTKTWNARLKRELGIHAPAGGGWIMVRARELTRPALLAALRAGDFYATSGVVLTTVDLDPARGLTVEVDLPGTDAELAQPHVRGPAREVSQPDGLTLEVVTQGGRVAHVVQGPRLDVDLAGLSGYARVRVTCVRDGRAFYAWTQPVLLAP
ncbi:MAG: CehA/McbA family metallohydrolase [Planctomycetota bacterium]